MAKALIDKKSAAQPKKKRRFFHALKTFFKNTWAELKKVNWPTRKTVIQYTGLVLAFICAFAVVVGLLDWGLTSLLAVIAR